MRRHEEVNGFVQKYLGNRKKEKKSLACKKFWSPLFPRPFLQTPSRGSKSLFSWLPRNDKTQTHPQEKPSPSCFASISPSAQQIQAIVNARLLWEGWRGRGCQHGCLSRLVVKVLAQGNVPSKAGFPQMPTPGTTKHPAHRPQGEGAQYKQTLLERHSAPTAPHGAQTSIRDRTDEPELLGLLPCSLLHALCTWCTGDPRFPLGLAALQETRTNI